MEPPQPGAAAPCRGRRRTRSTRSLTDVFSELRPPSLAGGSSSSSSSSSSPRASLVRSESQKEAKRTRRALDDWAEAEAELAAIEAELRSTRGAIAMLSQATPAPEPEPELEQSGANHQGEAVSDAVTAAREQLSALRRHHERCRSLLAHPPTAPSPAAGVMEQRLAEEEAAQRRRRAELAKVAALVSSIEAGTIDPEDLVGAGPSEEEVMQDILSVAVPQKDRRARQAVAPT
jgi:chromosome segregation ATPase